MPFSVDLYNSSIILQLTSDPYGIHVSGSGIGSPVANRTFSQALNRRFAPLLSTARENRMIEVPLQMTGDSMDDWIINSQQLHTVLRDAEEYNNPEHYGEQGDRAFIALQMPNATKTTVWEIICGDLEEGSLFQSVMAKTTPLYPVAILRLYCHKWGHPQQIVRVTSGTLDNGDDFFVMPSPQGEREAPCKITIRTAAGDNFRRMILAKRSRGNVNNFVWLYECETTGGTGYTITDISSGPVSVANVVDADAHGGNVLRVTKVAGSVSTLADIIRVTIASSRVEDMRGRHKVFLLCEASSSNWTAARISWGGVNGNAIPNDTVTSSPPAGTQDAVCLGDIEIPYPYSPPGAGSIPPFSFIVEMSLANANFSVDQDNFYLIPCDEQYAEIELADAASAAQDQMVWDNLSIPPWTYLLDLNGDVQSDRFSYGQDARFTVTPGKDNAFFCIFAENPAVAAMRLGGVNLTDTYVMVIEYLPQYELLI